MPSDSENGRPNDRKLKSVSAQDDYDVGGLPEASQRGDPAGSATPASSGRVGAAPIHWGWWASGLIVSIGIWWLIARTLG